MKKFILLALIASFQVVASDWTLYPQLPNGPRGGSTIGVPVEYDTKPSLHWLSLQEEGISTYEKDRRAIYALQGEFEVSFEFIETIRLETQRKEDTPYGSKGTEFVRVIEDRGDFISLQHIMVMFHKNPETGETYGPILVKHWRQDWQWSPTEITEFQGDNRWMTKKLSATEGTWSWSVAQVDDTPRYAGVGKWEHFPSTSIFSTGHMSRPLPRREFSVRSDYKLLLGTDALILTPNSWFHEQRNFKHQNILGENGEMDQSPFLAREIGHNSYKRIKNFDFSAGYEYWEKTKGYWKDVRDFWVEFQKNHSDYSMKKKVDGKSLYMRHFEQAATELTGEARKELVRNTIRKYLK